MPRDVRILLFGQNHSEIDLKGSFYELIRRLGMLHMPSHSTLPPITDLRTLLSNDPYVQTLEALRPGTVKQLPLRIINSTIEDTIRYLQSVHEGSLGAVVIATLNQLWLQAKALTDQMLPRIRPEYPAGRSDSTFRLLEYFEANIVEDAIRELISNHPVQSVVWIHDGFLMSPAPTESHIRQVEANVLAKHQLYFDEPWFRITSLVPQFTEYVTSLRGTAHAPALTIARRQLPQDNHQKHEAVGLPQNCMAPLEALAKVRTRRDNRKSTN